MKNSWIMWVLIVGVFIGVLVILNYQGTKSTMPLSEVFKEDKSRPNDIEYEFITNNAQTNQVTQPATASATNAAPSKISPSVSSTIPLARIPSTASVTPKTASATEALAVIPQVTSQDMKKVPFTIHVSSFQDKTKADKITGELTKKGYNPSIVSMNLGDKGTWYRIYVGKYDTKAQAEEVLVKIKEEYKSSFIIAPKAIR